jgi:hypothetical protein
MINHLQSISYEREREKERKREREKERKREREKERKREREKESFRERERQGELKSNLNFVGFSAAMNPTTAEMAKMIPHQIPDPISFIPK